MVLEPYNLTPPTRQEQDALHGFPPSRDLLWKASGLSWDSTRLGLGISKTKQNTPKRTTLKPTGAACREGCLSKLEESDGHGGQKCLR